MSCNLKLERGDVVVLKVRQKSGADRMLQKIYAPEMKILQQKARKSMKKRIWNKIKRTGLTAVLAGILMVSVSAQAQMILPEEERTGKCSSMNENENREFFYSASDGKDTEDSMIFIEEQEEIPLQEESMETPEENIREENQDSDEQAELPEVEMPEENTEVPEDITDGEGENGEQEQLPEKEENADFTLETEAVPDTAVAGKKLLYEIKVENTGNLPFKEIRFTEKIEEGLSAVWENENGEQLSEPVSGRLEPGEKRIFYMGILIPEDWTNPVNLTLNAEGEIESEEHPGELPAVKKEVKITTEISPLKVDFQVTKTADRTVAVPGDRILFRICIRNTGERTLHSIITTEKFQLENVPAVFLEQEGVLLNNTKTKALINRLEAGRSISLQAVVALPEKIKEKKLINEVEVVSKETGEKSVTSQAELQIQSGEQETEISGPAEFRGEETVYDRVESHPVSVNPKTGDSSDSQLMKETAVLTLLMVLFLTTTYKKRKKLSEEE